MKSGARALGIAESYREKRSTLAGVVVRRDRAVDGVAFGRCAVGGTDATDTVCRILDRLNREDIQVVFIAGIAPAWYNLLDLRVIEETSPGPVISVSFEASDGLGDAIADAFDGAAQRRRLQVYREQPDRQEVALDGDTVYVRAAGVDPETAREMTRSFTPEGGRPEPLRVARLLARGADEFARHADLDGERF